MKLIISEGQLGDRRRNERMFDLVQWLTRSLVSAAGVPNARVGWAMAMGAWRFFNNSAISLAAAYDVVRTAIRAALGTSRRCFVVHDVSLLDFTRHNAKTDRVPIGDHRGAGYELFSALVLNEHGDPVGPVFQEIRVDGGTHSSEPLTKQEAKRGVAKFTGHIEQMEKAVVAVRSHLPSMQIVHLGDREFEDVKAMRVWVKLKEQFILRVQHLTRRVLFGTEHVRLEAACEHVKLQRAGRIEHDGEQYTRWQGEIAVVLDGLSKRGRHRGELPTRGEPITVRVIVVELRATKRETIRWVLMTNTEESIDWIVQAYVWRWRVERYFYLVKVGFKLDAWLQQSGEALARKLAVMSLSAMVTYQLVNLTDDDDPERGDAIRAIAAMGGWLGRKRDPIGPVVLLRGVTHLLNAATAILDIGEERILALAEEIMPGFTTKRPAPKTRRDV